MGAAVKFACMTGVRRGELLSLCWKDIDWDKRLIYARRTINRVKDYDKSEKNSAVNTESSIKCDVNLMYDGAYSERVMIKNKQLNVPVKITNTAGNPKSVICFLAEYGEKGELLDSVSSGNVNKSAVEIYPKFLKLL